MKKTLFVFILICVTLPAFSQMRMNGWGRAVWVPVFYDYKNEEWRSTVQSSYGDQPDLEFMFAASSTNIGVDVGVIVNTAVFNQIANAKVWWRPSPDFRLHVGLGRVTALRGKVEGSTGGYSYARGRITGLTVPSGKDEPIVMINDGDGIFSRFNLSKMGAIMEITPTIVPGLFVGASLAPEFTLNSGLKAEDVYKGIHTAIGYEIKGIGLARLGYVGGGSETDPQGKVGNAAQNWDFSYDRRVEAAFMFNMVPGVLADFGFKYSLEKNPGVLEQPGFSLENPLYLALGVVYSGVENLKVGLAIDGHFAGKAEREKGTDADGNIIMYTFSAPQIAFNIYPSYNIGFCDIGADFTFGIQMGKQEGINNKRMLGFGVYGHKPYGHGNVRLGIYANAPMNEGQKWGMSVPLWITYSF